MTPRLDTAQFLADLEVLAEIGGDPLGMDRVAYGPADLQARAWVVGQLEALGLETRVDEAGNTIATYGGACNETLPIALGSHTDTVPRGGRFDGALGVVAAMASVRALVDADLRLHHPVEILNFAAEEATMAGGTTGSQAMAGIFDLALLDKPAWDGRPVREHLLAAGLEPENVPKAAREIGSLAAYLELHIEQGDRLLTAQVPIGVVTGFVGIRRYAVTFRGEANHAGTTSMSRRQDALVLAAPFVGEADRLARDHDIVATVGAFQVHPGAPNVIPGRVDLIVETRGLEPAVLDLVGERLRESAVGVGASFESVVTKPPVECHRTVIRAIGQACEALELESLSLDSGAGHDGMNMARVCPQGMIFVPSQRGISHSPDEYTTPEHCVKGARLLFDSLLELDRSLSGSVDAAQRPESP